jgi:hypothetical protein
MTILGTSSGRGRLSDLDGAGLFCVGPLVGSVQLAKRIHGFRLDEKTGFKFVVMGHPDPEPAGISLAGSSVMACSSTNSYWESNARRQM